MSHFPHQTNGPASAQQLSFYTDNRTAMSPPPPVSPPPMPTGYDLHKSVRRMGDNATASIEADVADTYATGSGNYYTGNGNSNGHGNGNGGGGGGYYYTANGNVNGGGGGGGHTEYPYSPSDVQRPRPSPTPGMLWPPPPPSTVGDDDTMSVASGAHHTSRYPFASRLPNIAEAAAASGSGQPYRPNAWVDGEQDGAAAAAAAAAATVPEPPQPPKPGKRSSRIFSRLRKDRRGPEPQPPTAAFGNLSVGGGGAASRSTAPAAPGQPPGRAAQGQEKAAALRIKVTAADIREATDLLRQLYRMELQIHDDRFVVDDGTSALEELRASRKRADRLCMEIERRVQQWADTQGSSWDPSEKEHVDYSAENIKALWNLGKSSRRRLQERP